MNELNEKKGSPLNKQHGSKTHRFSRGFFTHLILQHSATNLFVPQHDTEVSAVFQCSPQAKQLPVQEYDIHPYINSFHQ